MRALKRHHKGSATNDQPAAPRVMTALQHAVMSALPVTSAAPIKVRHPAARRKATTVALARTTAPIHKAAIVIATHALRRVTSTTADHLNVTTAMSATTAATALRHAKAPIAMTAETTAAPMAAHQAARLATRWHLRHMPRHRARTMAVSACPK